MGTTVLKGRGILLVDGIGMNTEMGKIANLLDNIEEEKSPLREIRFTRQNISSIMFNNLCSCNSAWNT